MAETTDKKISDIKEILIKELGDPTKIFSGKIVLEADKSCDLGNIAKCIDHTMLKPDTTKRDVERLCGEAKEFGFASVCINPCFVTTAAAELKDSEVKVCTVIGFPSGAHKTEVKVFETETAIKDGAEEIDMVINIGELKSGNNRTVYDDIRAVCEICKGKGVLTKVIIETALLREEEKIRASLIAGYAGADYVKTSTGFASGGATVDDVSLMTRVVGKYGMKVKASGGIRSFSDAKSMIEAGASRIGASAGINIVKGSE